MVLCDGGFYRPLKPCADYQFRCTCSILKLCSSEIGEGEGVNVVFIYGMHGVDGGGNKLWMSILRKLVVDASFKATVVCKPNQQKAACKCLQAAC